MTARVTLGELEEAFLFVSGAPMGENRAFVSLDTGEVHWVSHHDDADLSDEVPDDVETSNRYTEVPHRSELDLGQRLLLRFVRDRLPGEHDEVRGMFRGKDAHTRVESLLEERGLLEDWRRYEEEAYRRALREWCEEEGLTLVAQNDAQPG